MDDYFALLDGSAVIPDSDKTNFRMQIVWMGNDELKRGKESPNGLMNRLSAGHRTSGH